jgi:uncharacterized protein (DUF2147 family)
MTCGKPLLAAAFAALLIATSTASAQQGVTGSVSPYPTGEWLVAKQVARIKIADCNGRLWGVVAWEAQPGVDRKNPDPNLRSRPTLGMPILLGMTRSKLNQWDGQIYNSEDGNTYSANISLLNPSTLKVQGCFLGFLCGGENWSRVETPPEPIPLPPVRNQPPPPKNRNTTGNQPPAADDVCLRLFGPPRLPHERGLK